MVQTLNNTFIKTVFCSVFLLLQLVNYAQEITPPDKQSKFISKKDTSYGNYSDLRFKVASAQINLLKNEGALLVRLKTNTTTITKLKSSGNIDLATQIERETMLSNKIIIASYLKEFTFCPVYFFYSHYSDSVKYKKLNGIFVDTNLILDPSITCNAKFYLIAESGQLYNSSLEIMTEAEAIKSSEKGSPMRESSIIIKNRYFIQLHKPFPFFQVKKSSKPPLKKSTKATSIDLVILYNQLKRINTNSFETKQLLNLSGCVRALNQNFEEFYTKSKNIEITNIVKEFVF